VIPATLKEIEKGRRYSVVVALSAEAARGRIHAVVAEGACADAAGNRLQRTNLSSCVIRFGACPSSLWSDVFAISVLGCTMWDLLSLWIFRSYHTVCEFMDCGS
jgi:hypothetical protein